MRKRLLSLTAVVILISAGCGGTPNEGPSETNATLDTGLQRGPFLGFGIAIHSADLRFQRAFDSIKPSFVRMEFGPDWAQVPERMPSGVSIEEFVAHVSRNYDADGFERSKNAQLAQEFFRERETEIIQILFEVPFEWRSSDSNSQIKPEHVEDLARFHTAHLLYLESIGVTPDYMELANEPDGFWNGYIPPRDYNRLLLSCHTLFQEHLKTPPKILGPGLTFLNLHGWAPAYFEALEPKAVQVLYGWSTHAWDEVEFQSSRPEYMYGVWQPFLDKIAGLDPTASKPIFVTEYATDALEYSGERFPSPRDKITENAADEWPYAVRVIANSITHLNRGANALILYRLTNSYWHETGWGIIQPSSETEFTPRPAFYAVSEIFSDLPKQSTILEPKWYEHDDPITLTALLNKNESVTLIMSNATPHSRSKTVTLPKKMSLSEGMGRDQNGTFTPQISLEDLTLDIQLPGQSIAKITIN